MILNEEIMLETLKRVKIITKNTMWYFRLVTPLLLKINKYNKDKENNSEETINILSLYLAIKLLKYNQIYKKYNLEKDKDYILPNMDLTFDVENMILSTLGLDKDTVNEMVLSILKLKQDGKISIDFISDEPVTGNDLDIDLLFKEIEEDTELDSIEFIDNKYSFKEIKEEPIIENEPVEEPSDEPITIESSEETVELENEVQTESHSIDSLETLTMPETSKEVSPESIEKANIEEPVIEETKKQEEVIEETKPLEKETKTKKPFSFFKRK